ncbi:MAG: extracellular solute-binding protein [Rhodobacteraceae bacterium]|nr:extracellular solute-binding protein [Paracoccaceae bacterium]
MNKLKSLTAIVTLGALVAPAAASGTDLLILDWSGYEDENFFPAFIEKHGASPTYSFFGDDDEAFQLVRAGFRSDLTRPCSQMVQKYRDADLIVPWDTSRIAALDDLNPAFLASDTFRDGDELFFIPVDWGATAIAWNTDQVPADAVSTLQVFHDPAFANRISLPDNTDDVWSLAFLATGVSDWTQATDADFDRAAEWLRAAHANVRTYWNDGAELQQLMASGEILIAWSWNESFVGLVEDGHPIAFQREAVEGSSTWFCGFVKMANRPGSEDQIYDFINAWLEPRVTEYIVEAWGYGHSNATAMAAIDAELLDAVGLGEISAPVLAQIPLDVRFRERMVQEFELIKSGF